MESGENTRGVLVELTSPSPVLAVAFGGMLMQMDGIPPFEFMHILEESSSAKRLFVRDMAQAYYHLGVEGLGEDVASVADGIRLAVEQIGASRVVMMGASMGGYAALLFGRLLGVAEVHAFAPTTFIAPRPRAQAGDRRFQGRWLKLMRSGRYQS